VADAPDAVNELVAERAEARAAGDYGRADAIRAELADLGWDVVDSGAESTVRARPGR
jgi:cysteinyl-tRNA synthetase